MNRALVLAALLALSTGTTSGQALGVLRITVTLIDATRGTIPVPKHLLLISDNPSSSTPRRMFTKPDGTIEVSLRAGSYTVESDEPVVFAGKGYQWTQIVNITAGREVVLALTAANAEVGDAPASSSSPSAPSSVENSPSLLLAQWQDSLVSIWTPESRASGFVVDAAGLVVTNQRSIGSASAIEVQLSPTVKVPGRVIATDIPRDVVVLWIDPGAIASAPPLPLACGDKSPSRLVDKQPIVALSVPLRGAKDVSEGEMVGTSAADIRLAPGGGGGPVLNLDGAVVGLSTIVDRPDARRRIDEVRIVPIATLCDAVASATKAMSTAPRPAATRLPVEPQPTGDAPKSTVKRDAVPLSAYQLASSGFDITFVTPVVIDIAHDNSGRTGMEQDKLAAATDFGDWTEYFADVPPVLVVRVTPKFSESFWAKVARGAAYTQGAVLPPLKRFQPGFARMQAFCGDAEVTPIHPFTLARRISETDAVREGLYVFDPVALGPQCKSVRLVLFSEKEPTKPDARIVDAPVIERVWNDLAPFRKE